MNIQFQKENDDNVDFEKQRRNFWCDIYVAYVASSNSVNTDGGAAWADKALERFDERFEKEQTKK